MKKRNLLTTIFITMSLGLASCASDEKEQKASEAEQRQTEQQQQQEEDSLFGIGDNQEQQQEKQMQQEDESFAMEEQSDKPWADQKISLSDAEKIQQTLNDKGYHVGNVDGLIGPKTEEGLKNFQERENLQASGELNQETIDALGVDVDLKQAQEESQKSETSE